MGSKEIRIEVLTFIDNFWTTITTWSSIIIGYGGMSGMSFAREGDSVSNFLTIGEGGGVRSGYESMTMFFSLSFLEILGHW